MDRIIHATAAEGLVKMEVLTAKYDFTDETLKITLQGEIDHHTAKAARMEIDEQIYAHRAKNVIIDLENVGFRNGRRNRILLQQ